MKFDAAFITAIVAALGLAGGWYRSTMKARSEAKQDRSESKHSELDILIQGFQQLARDGNTYRTEAERKLKEALNNLFNCENTGRELRREVESLKTRLTNLEEKR